MFLMINVVQHWFEKTCVVSQASTGQVGKQSQMKLKRKKSKHISPDRAVFKNSQFFSVDRFKPQNEKIKCQKMFFGT